VTRDRPRHNYLSGARTGEAEDPLQDLSDTDTDTESDDYDEEDFSDVLALPESQQGESLYWAYRTAKRKWRRFSHKPTRKVRRFTKRKGGKGKGGKRSSAYIAEAEVQAFFKGKGKRTSRSSGKGLGSSRTNPKGADGLVMKCSICGSESLSSQVPSCFEFKWPRFHWPGAPTRRKRRRALSRTFGTTRNRDSNIIHGP
jgi:hypothetical protein